MISLEIKRIAALWGAILLLISLQAVSEAVPTPTLLEGGVIVGVVEAKALLDNQQLMIIDVRNPLNYGRGHLPGAILLPYKGRSQNHINFDPILDYFPLEQLGADKQTPLLFYSHGATGWKSFKAATQALRHGYQSVYWLRAGLQGWTDAGLATANHE